MRKHICILEDFPRENPSKVQKNFSVFPTFMKNYEKFTFNFAGKLITLTKFARISRCANSTR